MSTHRSNRIPSERPGAQGGKRDLNRQRRIQALIDAGTELFLATGIEAVTIDEIARAAGTAKGNFYRYFNDKEDLVAAILEPSARATREAMRSCLHTLETAGPSDTTRAYVELAAKLSTIALAHPKALQLYLQERRAPGAGARASVHRLAKEYETAAVELSRFALERGLLSVRDPRVSALAVLGAIETLALSVLRGELDLPPALIGETLVRLVLDGIRPR